MTQTIEQLTARVRELEEEKRIAELIAELEHIREQKNLLWFEFSIATQQLAAEQLNNKLLREALEFLNARIVTMDLGGVVERALSITASTEALDKYVAEKVNKIESCRDWYKRRIDLLQEWQRKMRDPERTIVCDIIANGLTMPEGGRYEIGKSDLSTITKQRDLAVEALENCRLLAARHRKEEWAGHIMRFCKDAGLSGSPIRNDSIKESENNKAS